MVQAAERLAAQGVGSEVLSITSWSELARQAQTEDGRAYLAQLLAGAGPIVAASDYVRAVPESLRASVPAGRSYTTLGTDGFGRSDTRAALRRFFGVDAQAIAQAAQQVLAAAA